MSDILAPSPRSTHIELAWSTPGPFELTFPLFETDSLTVYVNGEVRSDYTLSANFVGGRATGATITFLSPLDPCTITIDGDLPIRRELNYLPRDPRLVANLNIDLTRHVAMMQELSREAKRSLRTTVPQPPIVSRPGHYLVFNEAGQVVSGPDAGLSIDLQGALDDADAAAASALASLGQVQELVSIANWRATLGVADGVQTVWTLPFPVTVEEHLSIWFDGQRKHDGFTVAGAILTFTAPPPFGVTIRASAKPGLSGGQVQQVLNAPAIVQAASTQAVQAATQAQISANLAQGIYPVFATKALADAAGVTSGTFCIVLNDETRGGRRTVYEGWSPLPLGFVRYLDSDIRTYPTRALAVADAYAPPDGTVIIAGGVMYEVKAGATAFSDWPNRVPLGTPTVQHWGIQPDLVYSLQPMRDGTGALDGKFGFVRTSATNWKARIIEADAWCEANGYPLIWNRGGYYWNGEIEMTTTWLPEGDWDVAHWAEYAKKPMGPVMVSESGLVIKRSGVYYGRPGSLGFQCIGQFALLDSVTGPKETNNGHRGTFLRLNEYYWHEPQPILRDVGGRMRLVRAARVRNETGATLATGRSVPSILVFGAAGIENSNFEFDVWGKTNVASQYIALFHWGCYYNPDLAPFDDATTLDKTPTLPVETYHTLFTTIRFLGVADNADGHGLQAPYEFAAGGYNDCWNPRIRNVVNTDTYAGPLGVVSCGDLCNAFAVESQKKFVGGRTRIFGASAENVTSPLGNSAFYVKGLGTSKAIGDYEPGTTVFEQRQMKMEVELHDATVTFAPGSPQNHRGLFIDQVQGSVLFPGFNCVGAHRGVEVEYSRGRFEGSLSGDGVAINNFSDTVIFNDVDTDRGNTANAGDTSNYALGFASPNSRAIEVLGDSVAIGTLSSGVTIGQGILNLSAPTTTRVNAGSVVLVGTNRLITTAARAVGSVNLAVSPVIEAVSSGATVTLQRQARSIINRPRTSSSHYAIRVINAECEVNDPGQIRMFGRNAIFASGDSRVVVSGGSVPLTGSRADIPLTDRRTFRIEGTSRLTLRDMRIRDNPRMQTHIIRSSTARVTVENCDIENVTQVTTVTNSWDQVAWVNNRDFTGAVALHPGRSVTALPELLIGGTAVTSYSARSGTVHYSDNGDVVWVFDMTLSSRDGLTGNLSMTLPLGLTTSYPALLGALTMTGASLTTSPIWMHSQSVAGTTFLLQRQSLTGVATLTEGQITDTARIRGQVQFRRT
jgi:hypothetical protein